MDVPLESYRQQVAIVIESVVSILVLMDVPLEFNNMGIMNTV